VEQEGGYRWKIKPGWEIYPREEGVAYMKQRKVMELTCPVPGARTYKYGSCVVVVGHEKGRWHISISHQNRLPKWEEVRDARYQFVPKEVTMVMVLPRPEQYVNLHPNCLHLWETTDMVPGEWG